MTTTRQEIVERFGEQDIKLYYDELHIMEENIYKLDGGNSIQFVYKNNKLKVIWFVDVAKTSLEEISVEKAEKLLINRSKLGKEIL